MREPAAKRFDLRDLQLHARSGWVLGTASLRSLAEDDEFY
jgi:hypothetical protein